MKGYSLLLLTMAALLLLLPLPALPRQAAADTTPTESDPPPADQSNPAPDTSADTSQPDPLTGQFRMLCGTEVVTLEEREFLVRTLAMEMSPTYHTEALKAQAVAAYTYYARRRQMQADKPDEALQGADFITPKEDFPAAYTEEKLRERWGSQYDAYYEKVCQAIDAVAAQTITHSGTLIDACYHSISSGCTESARVVWGADIPYLQAVASPGDRRGPGVEAVCTHRRAGAGRPGGRAARRHPGRGPGHLVRPAHPVRGRHGGGPTHRRHHPARYPGAAAAGAALRRLYGGV